MYTMKTIKGKTAILFINVSLLLFTSIINSTLAYDKFNPEKFRFERISTRNGLSSNNVFSIMQDRKGFLWISTGNGLNRFDGYSSKVFKSIPDDSTSLSDNRILVSFEDKNGYIWIGTMQGGLNKYDKYTQKIKRYPFNINDDNTLKGERVFSIYQDSKDLLWIGTSSGLFLYIKEKDIFQNKNSFCFGDKKAYTVRFIKEDFSGNLWIGTSNGLYIIDASRNKVTSLNTSNSQLNNNFINGITFDKNNNAYIATEKGVNIYNLKTKKFTYLLAHTDLNSISSNIINCILYDQLGYLWIGTNLGLDLYDPNTNSIIHFKHNPQNSYSISFDFITHLFEDNAGNIWISTFSGGINKYIKTQPNISIFSSSILNTSSNMITSLTEINSNLLLLGTYEGLGILNLNNQQFTPFFKNNEIRKSPISSCIVSLAKESQNIFWFGTLSKGLVRFNLKTKEMINYTPDTEPSINDINVNVLTFDKNNTLWIGTISGGIARYDKAKNIFIKYQHNPNDSTSLSNNRIKTIFVDSRNNIWIGTEKGLNIYDRDKNCFKRIKYSLKDPYSLNDDHITGITEDKDGNIWVGTFSGGINKYEINTNKFIHYAEKYVPFSYQIKSLLVDDENNLWFSTNNGLFRYNIKNDLLSVFDEGDGLKSTDFTESVRLKMSTGSLIFGSHKFFIIINPKNLFKKEKNYEVVITDFKIFGKSIITQSDISEVHEINLSYKENYFTIEFASLDLRNSNKINYSYKMEGFDNNWIDCGKRRYASFMNLKGKTYLFKIRASRNDGLWYESSFPLKITIDSPPWERWYAYVFYVVFIISIMSIIIKVRTRIQSQKIEFLQEKQKLLAEAKQTLTNLIRRFTQLQEEERSYISRELHDGINQTIASIKLGVDKLLLDKNTPKSLIPDLEFLQNYLKEIIQEIRNISQNLRPSILDDFGISSAIKNLCDDFMNKTGINVIFNSFNLDKRLGYEIESNLYRIFQEVLNNIRKHSEATEVIISMQKDNNMYVIKIKDNGKGFDTKNIFTAEFANEHFGLNNIKKRAELIGAELDIISAPGLGTDIIIKIPF